MKKCLLLLLLCSLSYSFSIGQTYHPFPKDSARWSIRHTISNPFSYYITQYKMKGDTLLNGKSYCKIYTSYNLWDSFSGDTLHCFFRDDTASKKGYVKYPAGMGIDTNEFVIYDFSKNLNDTVEIRLIHFTDDSIFKCVISDTMHTILYNGENVKTYRLFQIDTLPWAWGLSCYYNFYWSEKMGSSFGLLYDEIPQYGCDGDAYEIQCFWAENMYLWGGGICSGMTGIETIWKTDGISLFPNPVYNESVIKLPSGFDYVIFESFNFLGKKISIQRIEKNASQIIINKKDYPPDCYFFKITDISGNTIIGKFIVL